MTIIPPFLKRNWSLKLLSLTIALTVYYALREREITLPEPASAPRTEESVRYIVVTRLPDGSLGTADGRVVHGTNELISAKGTTNAVPAAR